MQKIEIILREAKAVMTGGHFVYTSGLHGSAYVNKDALYPDVMQMEEIGKMLAAACPHPEVVLGPAVGGALLAQWVTKAFFWGKVTGRHPVFAAYADKDGDDFVIKRGYDKLIAGKQVLLVEDILNTGDSARKAVAAAQKCGAEVIAVGAICNRAGVTAEYLGAPHLRSLLDVTMDTYPADNCPLCNEGVPINIDVGHGKVFLERKRGEHIIEGGMPPLL